jgi:RNA ligase
VRFDRELLDSLTAEGWLRSRRHPEADLWIYNYTERTQYEKHWTPETLACRGLILDADGEVIARPFGKFFNHGDPQIGEIPVGEPYRVTEKVDGSLGIAYELGGETLLASRGSFDSEQALEGTRMLAEEGLVIEGHRTPLFEIVYPSNRIVVDYGERRELVLLTAIDKETGLDAPLPFWTGRIVDHHEPQEIDALLSHERPNSEGYVIAFESGLRVKIKFAEYVRLHKIVTGINETRVWDALRNGDDLDALIEGVPDEIHAWVTGIRSGLQRAFDAELRKAERAFNTRPGADRKTLAAYFKQSDANLAVLFKMLDGKPVDELIWKAIKPASEVQRRASDTA